MLAAACELDSSLVLGLRVNAAAAACGQPTVSLIDEAGLARTKELIAAKTWPEKWDGTEHRGDEWLPEILPDGSVQPLLFSKL